VETQNCSTRKELARLEKTLLKRVLLADDRISDTVGGGDKFNKHRLAVLRWGRLGRHFPEVVTPCVNLALGPQTVSVRQPRASCPICRQAPMCRKLTWTVLTISHLPGEP